MKTNWTNVLIGAVVLAAVLYFLAPRGDSYEGFESSPGSIIGMVFAGVMGVGILFALFSSMSSSNSY